MVKETVWDILDIILDSSLDSTRYHRYHAHNSNNCRYETPDKLSIMLCTLHASEREKERERERGVDRIGIVLYCAKMFLCPLIFFNV